MKILLTLIVLLFSSSVVAEKLPTSLFNIPILEPIKEHIVDNECISEESPGSSCHYNLGFNFKELKNFDYFFDKDNQFLPIVEWEDRFGARAFYNNEGIIYKIDGYFGKNVPQDYNFENNECQVAKQKYIQDISNAWNIDKNKFVKKYMKYDRPSSNFKHFYDMNSLIFKYQGVDLVFNVLCYYGNVNHHHKIMQKSIEYKLELLTLDDHNEQYKEKFRKCWKTFETDLSNSFICRREEVDSIDYSWLNKVWD